MLAASILAVLCLVGAAYLYGRQFLFQMPVDEKTREALPSILKSSPAGSPQRKTSSGYKWLDGEDRYHVRFKEDYDEEEAAHVGSYDGRGSGA